MSTGTSWSTVPYSRGSRETSASRSSSDRLGHYTLKGEDLGLGETSLHRLQDPPLQAHCKIQFSSKCDTADIGNCQLEQGKHRRVGSGTCAEPAPGIDSVWPNVAWRWRTSDGADQPSSAGGATEWGPLLPRTLRRARAYARIESAARSTTPCGRRLPRDPHIPETPVPCRHGRDPLA